MSIPGLTQDGDWVIDERGVSYPDEAAYICSAWLDFCGCGAPEEVMLYVRDMLVAIDSKQFGAYEDMPYMFFAYWADHKGYLEHGTTARCPWLTDKGKELLGYINNLPEDTP